MSLINDTMTDGGSYPGRPSDPEANPKSNFRFVPSELATKCRKLIASYHDMHGYGSLPDMLWHSDARDVIDCDRELTEIFRKASKSRCAKRANDSFLLIATDITSLEILARDFAGWGRQYPVAKRAAEEMLVDYPMRQRVWFMDKYLYPSLGMRREFASLLDSRRA